MVTVRKIDFSILFLLSCAPTLTAPTSAQEKIVSEEQATSTLCATTQPTREAVDDCRATAKKNADAKLAALLDGGVE